MTEQTKVYPRLTIETLLTLEKRIEAHRTTLDDCLLIDHYVEATGNPGRVLTEFKRIGVLSFQEFVELLNSKNRDHSKIVHRCSGILLGFVHFLMGPVDNDEEIY